MEAQIMSSSLGAMGPLLAKLHQLLDSYEYQLPKPLPPREQIEHLITVLEEIYALLADLSREQAPSTMAKLWMDEVRDLSYEVEDYIDKTTHRHYDAGEEIPFDSEVEEFSTHVEQANDARARYDRYVRGRWASNPSFMVYGRAHVPTLSGEAAGLVGMGDLGSKLISWLRDDAEQLKKVVPILGPAGVGKTTLAQEVYRQIGGHFDCRAFVQASQTPDTRRLLRSMISQVQRHEQLPYAYTVQDLKDKLRGHLQRKRYFIVIDGLWETSSWDIVRSAFPEGTHCSRILVTTDIKEVALECCDYHSDGIFQMEQLGGKYPTELFFKRVFGSSKDECPEHLQKDSEEIIRTCDGLPLAIIMISSILSCEPANSELWKHVKECLSCSMKTNFTLKDMLSEIVLLSYNNLPNHLKTCLLYLSLYPEGYTFLKVDLVKQWTAEGFTSAAGKKGTNQDAEDFFDELVCRGLIQPYHINFPEEVMFYTVHSTVFEVIRNKSREDNFTTVVDYSNMVRQLSKKARRLSLIFSNSRYAKKPEGIKLSPVRSLNFYGLIECFPSMTKFEVLRVLVLELWGALEELDLSSINTLFQLRYLRIRTNVSVKLPAKMRDLKYLETLEIYARVTSVPSDIVDLSRLLHLCLPGEINLSNGIGHMKSLRSLQSFDLSSNSESNVRRLTEMIDLQYLHLTCSTEMSILLERNLVALASSLGEHGQLKSLVLEPGAGASCTSIYLDCSSSVSSPPVFLQRLELLPPLCIFSRLPKWIGRLRKLCTLKIALRELTSYDVSSITGLQELTVLSLYVSQPTAKSIIFNCAAFPVLKYFKLSCGILRLAFQAKAMPNLRWLNLKFNAHKQEQYGNMVAGIEHLLNLEEIAVRIGAGPGAEESDRTTAESAIKETICRHPRPLSISIRRVDSIVEEPQLSKSSEMTTNTTSSLLSTLPKDIPASFLKQITDDFSPLRELGKGAFGTVYQGIAENGEMIAVKKLGENCPVAHDKTFSNEVCNLMAAQHENIVKLVGYCHESQKKVVQHNGRYIIVDIAEVFLCYEYLPMGSLDKYLFGESNKIDWDTQFRIVQGICNGLHFLHKEMDQPVVHMDLKPENILLGDNMVPKIADFGLSRLFGQEQTRMNTQNVVGSVGYMAPEYLYRGEISTQSDIYSLGLLIIQISTGEKNTPNTEDKCGRKFIEKVQKSWTDGNISSKYTSFDPDRLQQIKMCVEIGLQCVEHERKMRPSIADIVEKLNAMQE